MIDIVVGIHNKSSSLFQEGRKVWIICQFALGVQQKYQQLQELVQLYQHHIRNNQRKMKELNGVTCAGTPLSFSALSLAARWAPVILNRIVRMEVLV